MPNSEDTSTSPQVSTAQELRQPGRPRELTALTRTEQRVVHLLLGGRSNKEIARALGSSDSTVRAHLRVIFIKTRVSSRLQLAIWAARGATADPN